MKCPHCGSDLPYRIATAGWACPACGSTWEGERDTQNVRVDFESLKAHYKAALDKLAESGWVPFGTHTEEPLLEFSTQVDEEGNPYFERAADHPPVKTIEVSDMSGNVIKEVQIDSRYGVE